MATCSSSHLLPNYFASTVLISRQLEIQDRCSQAVWQRAHHSSYLFVGWETVQHIICGTLPRWPPSHRHCFSPDFSSLSPIAVNSKSYFCSLNSLVSLPVAKFKILVLAVKAHSDTHTSLSSSLAFHHIALTTDADCSVIFLSSFLSIIPVIFFHVEKFPDSVYCDFSEEFLNFSPPAHLQTPIIVCFPTWEGRQNSRRQTTFFC